LRLGYLKQAVALTTIFLSGRYLHPERIAAGGMGEIFVAEDGELGRKVAIKVLADRYASNHSLRRRFEREALTAAKLSGHPHIVTIYDVGESDGRPLIVMEYLAGGTLAERARSGSIDHGRALAWLAETASALDFAHEQGVVHRDVKPANLLLDEREHVHVADFGIARLVDETTLGMTAAGTVMGTAGYLSPEQARGEPVTAASDRYGLGVVAYELLTGGRPFERGSATAEAAAHLHEPVPPASERDLGLPAAVDSVFERALAKEPADRYPTARQLVDDLRGALEQQEDETRLLAVSAAPARQRRRYLPAIVAAGLLAAGTAGAVVAAILSSGGGGAAPSTGQNGRQAITVTRTVTRPNETVTEQRTTTLPAGEPPSTAPAGKLSAAEAARVNDQAYGLMKQGRYDQALPLLERAVPALKGVGFPYEAYANYNLGYTLLQLGRCRDALRPLKVANRLENASAVDDAIARAKRCA